MRAQSLSGGGVNAAGDAIQSTRPLQADTVLIPGVAADGSLYPIDKMEAHRTGALHLAISVFVLWGDSLLLQRRAAGKYHSGGQWANTCCSHPAWGEAPGESAARRLEEELGLRLRLTARNVIDYAADVSNGLREHERVHVYQGAADPASLAVAPDPAEVSDVRWMALPDLRRDALARPGVYAPWLRIYLARWTELGLR